MAQTRKAQQTQPGPAEAGPVLRAGRPADPVPASLTTPTSAPAPAAPEAGVIPEATVQPTTAIESDPPAPAVDPEQAVPEPEEPVRPDSEAPLRQHRRRQLLRQCERVLLLDFDTLAMAGWPDSYALAEARRRRDLWLFSATAVSYTHLTLPTNREV